MNKERTKILAEVFSLLFFVTVIVTTIMIAIQTNKLFEVSIWCFMLLSGEIMIMWWCQPWLSGWQLNAIEKSSRLELAILYFAAAVAFVIYFPV